MRIKKLSDKLINLIAAGEVVERPSSVIKELIENSIDAKPSRVIVRIENAGKTLIEVADDGDGIAVEDADLLLERSATSKLYSEEDLENLMTFGFRGEALASISEVSELLVVNSSRDSKTGFELIKDTELKINDRINIPKGTTISVRNLFGPVPARKKFLKSDNTENSHIQETFITNVLPHIDIHFELYIDNKLVYRLPQTKSIYYRIYELYGKSIAESVIENKASVGGLDIHGYIGKPSSGKKNTKYQYIFINGRYVRNALINNAIRQAYQGRMHSDFRPIYFLFLNLDPKQFDINVHPRKLEVKFIDEQSIYSRIYNFTLKTLTKQEDLLTQIEVEEPNINSFDNLLSSRSENINFKDNVSTPKTKGYLSSTKVTNKGDVKNIRTSLNFTKAILDTKSQIKDNDEFITQSTFHGVESSSITLNEYALYKHENSILVIDQIKSIKWFLLNKLMSVKVEQKELFLKLLVELKNIEEKDFLISIEFILNKMGIAINEFGDKSIQITAIPFNGIEESIRNFLLSVVSKRISDEQKLLNQLLISISEEDYISVFKSLEPELLASKEELPESCKSILTTIELEKIIKTFK